MSSEEDYYLEPDGFGVPTIWVANAEQPDLSVPVLSKDSVTEHFWPDVVARMTGTTMVADEATVAAIGRVAEFLRQWRIARDKGNDIYGVHNDPAAEMADLTVTDLTTVVAALTGVPHD